MKKLLFTIACMISCGMSVQGQDAAPKPTVVLDGLSNPSGIAIQPETGVVFVADSGAGRVVRVVNGKAEPVIVDFKLDIYGKGPEYKIGPLGVTFLDRNTLVVGGGDLPDGEEKLRVYDLSNVKEPIKVDAAKSAYSIPASGDLKPEGNFYALAVTPSAIYVTSNGDDTKGWVLRATRNGNAVTGLERYLATKEATEVDAPVGITVSPQRELVVGQMGEISVPKDSLLTFYDAESKKMTLNMKTQLNDICGLAYSPKGQLYAVDFSWIDAKQGGLFQLIRETSGQNQTVRAKKLLDLDKPSALAFAPDGSLYVTVFGPEEKKGQLLKFAPGL